MVDSNHAKYIFDVLDGIFVLALHCVNGTLLTPTDAIWVQL